MDICSDSSRSGCFRRVMVTVLDLSTTTLPWSNSISRRSVPTRSLVEVMKCPVTPSPKSTMALTSSSVAISRWNPKASLAKTFFGVPASHCHRSSCWGAWFTSTPPPSPPQVARVDQGLQIGVDRLGALVEHDGAGGLGMLGREGVHLLDLRGVDAGRFLGEGVDALADRGDGQLRVVEVRDRGDHGVDVAGV